MVLPAKRGAEQGVIATLRTNLICRDFRYNQQGELTATNKMTTSTSMKMRSLMFVWLWGVSLMMMLGMPLSVSAQEAEAVLEEPVAAAEETTSSNSNNDQSCVSPVALEECHAEVSRLNDAWSTQVSESVQKVQEESLQAIQTLQEEHAQALAAALEQREQEYQAEKTAALQQAVTAALEESRASLETEKDALLRKQSDAIQTALQEQTSQHARAYELLQTESKRYQRDASECRAEQVTYQAKQASQAEELLLARRELLQAHEIVRLYELKFYNRWFFLPLTNAFNAFYETILMPLGNEIYLVAYPVLDPINDYIIKPLAPHVQAAAQQLHTVMTQVMETVATAWETTVAEISAFLAYLAEEIPPAMIQFLAWAGPKVWQFLQTVQQTCQHAYEVTHVFITTHVAPKWDEFVVQPIWVAHVLPWWAQTQPVLQQHWQDFQNALLPHWTETVTIMNAQAKQNADLVPDAVREGTQYMADHPRATLEMAEMMVAGIVGLILLGIILRLILGSSKKKKANKKVAIQEPSKKKHHGGKKHHAKQNGHYKTKSQ